MRRLADRRTLDRGEVGRLSAEALERVAAWIESGWLVGAEDATMQEEDRR